MVNFIGNWNVLVKNRNLHVAAFAVLVLIYSNSVLFFSQYLTMEKERTEHDSTLMDARNDVMISA